MRLKIKGDKKLSITVSEGRKHRLQGGYVAAHCSQYIGVCI